MKRASVLAFVVVIVLAALAGAGAAGRPSNPSDVRITGTPVPTAMSTSLPTVVSSTDVPSTTPAPTSATEVATTTTTEPIDPTSFRVVVANGTQSSGLAAGAAEWLVAIGYGDVAAVDAVANRPVSSVYFAPGFEEEARKVAVDLNIRRSRVEALPTEPVVVGDAGGDVVVVLGTDWVP